MFSSNCNTASVPLVANIDGNGNNGGCDYYFGEVLDTGDKVVISTENEYKSLDWAYNKALEIIKKEF